MINYIVDKSVKTIKRWNGSRDQYIGVDSFSFLFMLNINIHYKTKKNPIFGDSLL